MAILAPIAATIIQMAISRSREYLADAGGARISGNPYGLAGALEKLQRASQVIPMDANPSTAHMFIVNPLTGNSLMNLFSTHPPLEERIARLKSMGHALRREFMEEEKKEKSFVDKDKRLFDESGDVRKETETLTQEKPLETKAEKAQQPPRRIAGATHGGIIFQR